MRIIYMRVIKLISTIAVLCSVCVAHAESKADFKLTSLYGMDVEQLLREKFLGDGMKGIEIFNATYNGSSTIPYGDGQQIAEFTNNGYCGMVDIKSGLMLSNWRADEIMQYNDEYRLGGMSLTAEELNDFANNYLPALYQKKMEETYDPYMYYEYYYETYGHDYHGWPEDKVAEFHRIQNTDDVFLGAAVYYEYTARYADQRKLDYSEYVEAQSKLGDIYPIWAVHMLVGSWDPKYYTVSEEELEQCKKLFEKASAEDSRSFLYYYINTPPKADYDKTKVELYEQLRKTACIPMTYNRKTDDDLNALSGASRNVFYPTVIEFDFTTTEDSISFNYCYGMGIVPIDISDYEYGPEEYFAFVLTDSTGNKVNMAKVPGTDVDVSVLSVNQYCNSQYYIENPNHCFRNGDCNDIEYVGVTTTLTAKAQVKPCAQYHLKLALGNIQFVNNRTIFLEEGSFKTLGSSSKLKFTKEGARGIADGCSNGEIVVYIRKSEDPTTINIKHIGDARNGIDYEKMPEQVVVPANTDSFVLNLIPRKIETDSVEVALVIERPNTCPNTKGDTIRTYIYDNSPISITPVDPQCCATELGVEHTGKISKIRWTPSFLLSDNDTFVVHPKECPENDVVYTIVAENASGCQVLEKTLVHKPCVNDLSFMVELRTEDDSDELVEGCKEGELVLHINRHKDNTAAAVISINKGDSVNIVGLRDEFAISASENEYVLPIRALKTKTPYHVESKLNIKCENCNKGRIDTTLKISVTQYETLAIASDNVFRTCNLDGYEIVIPQISGDISEVVWEPADQLASVDKLTATLVDGLRKNVGFTVTAKDSVGCQTVTANVNVIEDLCVDVEIPPFFTPNGDGENDMWRIKGLENVDNSVAKVYDRWGKLLYIFNTNEEGWDGTYNGKPCASTDYWYEIDCEDIDKTYVGHFTLLR